LLFSGKIGRTGTRKVLQVLNLLALQSINSYAEEIQEAYKSITLQVRQIPRLTTWLPPKANLKLNTDGWWYNFNGTVGYGGIIRVLWKSYRLPQ
jgi:hypothetical protein